MSTPSPKPSSSAERTTTGTTEPPAVLMSASTRVSQMPSVSSGLRRRPRSSTDTPPSRSRTSLMVDLLAGLVVGVDEVAVRGRPRAQLCVGAPFGDAAVLEQDDLVGQRDRGLAVRDDDRGRRPGPVGEG